jgi:hypothetical protein
MQDAVYGSTPLLLSNTKGGSPADLLEPVHIPEPDRRRVPEPRIKVPQAEFATEVNLQVPHLSMGRIYSALAYYWDHKEEEIDRDLERRAQLGEELRRGSDSRLSSLG